MSVRKVITHIDNETGEILKEQVLSIEDLTVPFKVGSSEEGKSSRFSKVFQMEDPMFEVGSYYQYFFKCLLHLEMSTNRLVHFTESWKLNKPLDEKDFEKLFGASKKTVSRFFEYCKERNIIAKISKNDELYGYLVNPIYALNGNKITSMLYTIFCDSDLDRHIPTKELGRLREYLSTKPDTNDHIKN